MAVTSPAGFLQTEGNTEFNHFDSRSARRFQQIDATHLGANFVVRSLGFRRDGGPFGGGSNEPPRTMDFELDFGLADPARLSPVFDANYVPGSRTTAFTRRQVSMPDWTGNIGTPAPFDFVIALDAPIPYAGSRALVIDFTYENLVWQGPADGGSAVDREFLQARSAGGAQLGQGCVASGSTSPFFHMMTLYNGGGAGTLSMRLALGGVNAPASSPVIANIDLQDANLTIPGLCGSLRAGAGLTIPLGVADPSGRIVEFGFAFLHSPSIVGGTFVTQLLAPDPGQPSIPVVVSNGRTATMPSDPSSLAHSCAYHWLSAPGPSASAALFYGGGLVMELGL
jgi:hypothetical protein